VDTCLSAQDANRTVSRSLHRVIAEETATIRPWDGR
jgi:hypothetical protein